MGQQQLQFVLLLTATPRVRLVILQKTTNPTALRTSTEQFRDSRAFVLP